VEQPDEIIHQPIRLKIMSALKALPEGERVEFVRMRGLVKATDGTLGKHISVLEAAAYILVEKDFHFRKPRTRISLTQSGRRAFEDYVRYLKDVLENGPGAD